MLILSAVVGSVTLKIILAFILTIMVGVNFNKYEQFELNKNKTQTISNQPVAPVPHKHFIWLKKEFKHAF